MSRVEKQKYYDDAKLVCFFVFCFLIFWNFAPCCSSPPLCFGGSFCIWRRCDALITHTKGIWYFWLMSLLV